MAKAAYKNSGNSWTKDDVRALRAHSRDRTPLVTVVRQMRRTPGALRQKALRLGIGLGHAR